MITIQDGKLTIPEEERFVGVAGDNSSSEKQFMLAHFVERGCTFTMYLKFDDGTVRTVNLGSRYYSSDVLLTWNIKKEHLYSSGVVFAQVKITTAKGKVTFTSRDCFLVDSALNKDDESQSFVTLSELDERLEGIGEQVSQLSAYKNAAGRAVVRTADGDITVPKTDEVYTKTEVNKLLKELENRLS